MNTTAAYSIVNITHANYLPRRATDGRKILLLLNI